MKLPHLVLIVALLTMAFSAVLLAKDHSGSALKGARVANKEISHQSMPPHESASSVVKS